MLLTKQAAKLLKNSIEEKPLQEGEIRHIEAMGGLYVSTSRLDSKQDNALGIDGEVIEIKRNGMRYWYQYAVRFGSTCYYVYAGMPAAPESD